MNLIFIPIVLVSGEWHNESITCGSEGKTLKAYACVKADKEISKGLRESVVQSRYGLCTKCFPEIRMFR